MKIEIMGTTPALLEVMAANTFILAHDNHFNKSECILF